MGNQKLLIVTILFLAFCGYKAYEHFQIRKDIAVSSVDEALNLASEYQGRIMEYMNHTGAFPDSNNQLGIPPPQTIHTQTVDSLTVDKGGVITLSFNKQIGDAASLSLTPGIDSEHGGFSWKCSVYAIPQRYLRSTRSDCLVTKQPPAVAYQDSGKQESSTASVDTLMTAIYRGQEAEALQIIKQGVSLAVIRNGETALMLALTERRWTIARALIDAGADTNQLAPYHKDVTPLMCAAEYAPAEIIQELLDHGADKTARDAQGTTPLMYAAREANMAAAEQLIKSGADVSASNNNGDEAINFSVRAGYESKIYKFFKEQQQRPVKDFTGPEVDRPDVSGATLLMHAAYEGDKEKVKALIQRGANLEAQDFNGNNALRWAAWLGRVEAVELLLTAGADMNAQDRSKATALMLAVERDRADVVSVLLRHGADFKLENKNHLTAKKIAVERGSSRSLQLLNNAEILSK